MPQSINFLLLHRASSLYSSVQVAAPHSSALQVESFHLPVEVGWFCRRGSDGLAVLVVIAQNVRLLHLPDVDAVALVFVATQVELLFHPTVRVLALWLVGLEKSMLGQGRVGRVLRGVRIVAVVVVAVENQVGVDGEAVPHQLSAG